MNDRFTRVDTNLLAPWFVDKCKKLLENCSNQGADFYAICGYRSLADQAKLYAIGRTVDLGKPHVTNAQPYQSLHNYGLAIDFCRDADTVREGLQPDWKLADYEILATQAKKLGLEAAFFWKSFKEGPHIQTPQLLSTPRMEILLERSDLKGVWEEVLKSLQAHPEFKAFWS